MRLFIAVNIPDGLRDKIAVLQDRLRSSGAAVRWAPKENLHLTLKFLGETPESRAAEVAGALRAALKGMAGPRIVLGGLGAFPRGPNPRVIWAGVKEGGERLKDAAGCIEEALYRLGFEREAKEFTPHLTIARVKPGIRNVVLLERMGKFADTEIGGFDCTRIDLMESILKPSGPEYKCVNSILIS
jgi:RNA 2',3'-cyclic 3'-phosphodiesterase